MSSGAVASNTLSDWSPSASPQVDSHVSGGLQPLPFCTRSGRASRASRAVPCITRAEEGHQSPHEEGSALA